MEGVQAEFDRELDRARSCFLAAWESAQDDYDRCVSAHYLGHLERDIRTAHVWNEMALRFAALASAEKVRSFMPSLLVNIGRTHELLGEVDFARHFYQAARASGLEHADGLVHAPWLDRVEVQPE